MGFLNLFSRARQRRPVPPGFGSVTVDHDGRVMTSTLPHHFSARLVQEIVRRVLGAFRTARETRLPLGDIVVQYTSFKLHARKLRGGAIIFLSAPVQPGSPRNLNPDLRP